MSNVTITNPEQLLSLEGKTLGTTEWLTISQQRINLFAEATNDHQWIHVDEEKAAKGPFGACIAHGYLTLSLASDFLFQLIDIQNLAMGVNYGCNKIRFPAPVPVGSQIRGRGDVIRVEKIGEAYQAVIRITIEIEGSERPGCVVDTISRYSFK
ncbi:MULTISPECIES: MaoC family dehydratase [Vibrio]|uniref:MaoC family dehydratase n=1 Tax=Vibrio TaxID=662 RepID=UPI000C00025F|nr:MULTISPECIES: MaoC family dehydratase [unclassified Vibrio]PHJ41915.1 dehydratase [Vibrio sp. PID17_43]RIZ52945.1 dehydratase [Vibrio sp. PID23_8]